jgi:hypothetical protein
MRVPFLILLCFFSDSLYSQIPSGLSNWFYGIDLTTKSERLKIILESDNRIIPYPDLDTSAYSLTRDRTFFGRIMNPGLVSLNTGEFKIDSATIELTFGIISNTGLKNSSVTYSGWIRILNIEYFMDSSKIEKAFEALSKDSILHPKKYVPTSFSSESKTYLSSGRSWIFQNDPGKFSQFSIEKKEYTGTRLFALRLNLEVSE